MGPYVPPGQSPPFEVVDEYHHGAWIIITVALGLVVSVVCFLIRLYVRLMLIPPFARDDFVLLGATIVAGVQSTLIFYACSLGFGTSMIFLDDTRLNQIQTLIAISDTIALIILFLSKGCVLAIYLRLTPQKPHNRASWATLALCTAWLIPAVLILLVNCELNKPWRTQGGECKNLFKRWQFIGAVDIITEIIIFALAVILLKGLFMSVRRKLAIGFAFIFRFPLSVQGEFKEELAYKYTLLASLILFAILHISNLNSALNDADVTLAAVEPTLWLQVEVHYALVACSVFCLRPFMAAVSTNYGTAGDSSLESSTSRSRGTEGSSKSGSNSNSASGSNSASRSRSLSRVQRKRTGASSRSKSRSRIPRSLSKEHLCQGEHARNLAESREANGQKKKQSIPQLPETRNNPVRTPVRRSMFPISEPSKQTSGKTNKGKEGHREQASTPSLLDIDDAIELMPQLHRQHARQETHCTLDEEDPDKMVIRKEVQYSIQYEYGESRRKGRETSKTSSTDAVAYV
ncbi:hypothetical protein N7462_010458 [Penicillium macrosclerotiorum]|uniref:uncharacterized protein n=1 Tax=Penicillium macrosclerotiorum TaxID=303699 RepID=UPI0025495927|nr:uncharacterized protein N7462_010458 [Penicillium macrosclerotiorum]KAJ5669388.1 hypothetical protein N7462_010458 [Penicillium macrosclerotiorum]